MIVLGNGNVGIGTTTPAQPLDVVGNIHASGSVTATSFTGSGAGLTGVGTITGVTAGSGLSGGGSSGPVSLSLLNSCSSSQILKWNGASWACAADANSGGTITSVTAGAGLTGGALSGDAPLAMTGPALTRTITYLAGCDSCSSLTTSDSQRQVYLNLVGTMTINSVTCFSDAGAPVINVQRDPDGSHPVPILTGSNMTCSTGGASTPANGTLAQTTLSSGDQVHFQLITPDAANHRVTVVIKATVN